MNRGFVVVASFWLGCSKTAPTPPPPTTAPSASTEARAASSAVAGAEFTKRAIKPSDVDPATKQAESEHRVYVPAGGSGSKLLVYLPGTNSKTGGATHFYKTAAERGWLVIALDYPDHDAAAECKNDAPCYEKMREEVIEGVDTSTLVNVGPADSIHHRLATLLQYLAKNYPKEGWSAFLNGNEPQWANIAFAGHSQGGGHAAYIAKKHEVARVLMFSSVCDAYKENGQFVAAPWVKGHATPTERYWGFDHVKDDFGPRVAKTWPALGLDEFGARVSVDSSAPPYNHSHQLTTQIPEDDGQKAHTSVVMDSNTPIGADGKPQFEPVWAAMLGD